MSNQFLRDPSLNKSTAFTEAEREALGIVGLVPDVTETADLLVDGGYTVDADGRIETPAGTPLKLSLVGPAGNPLIASVEQELQAELLQSGITLGITNVSEKALLGTLLPSGAYELALAPYDVSPYPSTNEVLYTEPVGPVPPASSTARRCRSS